MGDHCNADRDRPEERHVTIQWVAFGGLHRGGAMAKGRDKPKKEAKKPKKDKGAKKGKGK
jgi:hypothetical protein